MMPPTNPLENFDSLANGMAHAIRNPLSSILTASTLVGEDPNISDETRMLLEVIVRESQHLNRIFTDFLEYVRPVNLNPACLNVAALLRRLAAQMQRDGALKDVELEVDETVHIWADEDSIVSALRQILLNAAQAMSTRSLEHPGPLESAGASGKITVSGTATGDTVQIIIDDQGPGLSPRQLERGFEPFFSDTADGTGLGLPLACSAIIAAGGTLELNNRSDGVGARAVISFPKAAMNGEAVATDEILGDDGFSGPGDPGATETGATETGATETGATETGATDSGAA